MSKIGFTGTRQGMTDAQKVTVAVRIEGHSHLHHGGAIGADTQVHALSDRRVGHVTVHLASESRRRWFATGFEGVTVLDPLPPLVRNRNIVLATDRLIAAPAGFAEEQRSGTWATVRYARKIGRPITIVWPDGTASEEGRA